MFTFIVELLLVVAANACEMSLFELDLAKAEAAVASAVDTELVWLLAVDTIDDARERPDWMEKSPRDAIAP